MLTCGNNQFTIISSDFTPNSAVHGAYTHALTGHKCPHNHDDRLFRSTSLTVEECYAQCLADDRCNHFSHGLYGGDTVCMGCTTLDNAQAHDGFDAYDMAHTHERCAIVEYSGSWLDEGYVDDYRGWYDVTGCGRCNDYCRWVGNSGSGGDPADALTQGRSWWSCRLAGSSGDTYTPAGHFSSWSHEKCEGVQHDHCEVVTRPPGQWIDEGYADNYRGWYDVSGCGGNDYCRWVGNSGSGGDPRTTLSHGSSWWSCRLAGTNEIYSPQGFFTSWPFRRVQ